MSSEQCSVFKCGTKVLAKGWCAKHYSRVRRYGDPLIAKNPNPTPRPSGPDSNGWKGDGIAYAGAHGRIKALRGSASGYMCVLCCAAPAEHWCYDHSDPNEKWELHRTGCMVPFSTSPGHYAPMCRPCHVDFDREHSRHRLLWGAGDFFRGPQSD